MEQLPEINTRRPLLEQGGLVASTLPYEEFFVFNTIFPDGTMLIRSPIFTAWGDESCSLRIVDEDIVPILDDLEAISAQVGDGVNEGGQEFSVLTKKQFVALTSLYMAIANFNGIAFPRPDFAARNQLLYLAHQPAHISNFRNEQALSCFEVSLITHQVLGKLWPITTVGCMLSTTGETELHVVNILDLNNGQQLDAVLVDMFNPVIEERGNDLMWSLCVVDINKENFLKGVAVTITLGNGDVRTYSVSRLD